VEGRVGKNHLRRQKGSAADTKSDPSNFNLEKGSCMKRRQGQRKRFSKRKPKFAREHERDQKESQFRKKKKDNLCLELEHLGGIRRGARGWGDTWE